MGASKTGRSLLLAVMATTLGLGVIELCSPVLAPLVDEGGVDPRLEELGLPAFALEELPESIRHNAAGNVLTQPDRRLLFRVRPNPGGGPVSGYSGINTLGFRGAPFDEAAARRGDERVLILGDSCAFGWQIPDYEKTFQARLERGLAETPGNTGVYSLAQPGYSSSQALVLLEDWLPRIEPDTVVVYVGWNDIWSSRLLTDRQYLALLRRLDHPVVRALEATHTYRLLRSVYRALAPAPRAGHAPSAGGVGVRVPIHEAIENHRAMARLADRHGARLVLVQPPVAQGHPNLRGIRGYNRRIRAELPDGVALLDLGRMSHRDPGSHAYFGSDGFHPNERGAEQLAAGLLEFVRSGGARGATLAGDRTQPGRDEP